MSGRANELIQKLFSPKRWDYRLRLWRERLGGVDFSTNIEPEEVGLDPRHANRSSPSGSNCLRRLLADLDLGVKDRIIDIGCGKGSAMRVMLEFPFARVDGVELSEEIARIARRNFDRLGISGERCTVFTADACEFPDLHRYNFLYLYNPFSCEVMQRFLQNLKTSMTHTAHHITLIYDNPVCHEMILADGIFLKRAREYPDEWGNKFYVYSSATARPEPQ